MSFQAASEMSYANNDQTQNKTSGLIQKLTEHLKLIEKDKSLFF